MKLVLCPFQLGTPVFGFLVQGFFDETLIIEVVLVVKVVVGVVASAGIVLVPIRNASGY